MRTCALEKRLAHWALGINRQKTDRKKHNTAHYLENRNTVHTHTHARLVSDDNTLFYYCDAKERPSLVRRLHHIVS